MPTCAIYARVSTDRQADSVEHQVSLLREVARRRGREWIVPDAFVFEDAGVSATRHSIWSRPAMRRLLADAERGVFSVVLFKGVSRFARNTQEALDVLDRLKARGLRVISYEENYDSAREHSNFMFTMHAAIAEYEAEKIGVRVRLGNKEKAKTGRFVGGTPPDGYLFGEDGRLRPDPVRRGLIGRIFLLYATQGESCGGIARHLNEAGLTARGGGPWHGSAVARVLQNEAYVGRIVYNRRSDRHVRDYDSEVAGKKKEVRVANPRSDWVVVEGAHEPLVDAALFASAGQRLAARRPRERAPRTAHPLTGLLVCERCGRPMICQRRRTGGREYRYYICRTYHDQGRGACAQPSLNAETLEAYLACRLSARLREAVAPEALPVLLQPPRDQERQLVRQLRAVERRLASHPQAARTADWRRAREECLAALDRLRAVYGVEDVRASVAAAHTLRGPESLPFSDTIRRFIRRVAADGKRIRIEYAFAGPAGVCPSYPPQIDGHV